MRVNFKKVKKTTKNQSFVYKNRALLSKNNDKYIDNQYDYRKTNFLDPKFLSHCTGLMSKNPLKKYLDIEFDCT